MKMKKFLAVLAAFAISASFTGCGDNGDASSNEPDVASSESSEAEESSEESSAEPETEEPTEEELVPPSPVECDDPNGLTFDDGDIGFATIKDDDADSAQGELQVVSIQGNPMLAFVDSGTNFADGTVQKIKIDAAQLLSHENVAKVRSIELDVYATATDDKFVNKDKENVFAPGWIGGGGGANVAGDKWFDFSEWEGGEYNFDTSGPIHVQFKFLLAAGGQCWDETMEEATFQVMRWGAKNEGDFLIDNIVFKDEDGNSLPIEKPGVAAPDEEEPMNPMAR